MTVHHLEPGPTTTVQVFSPNVPAVLTVNPGDTVRVRSLDAVGHLQRQTYPGEEQPQMFADRKGHCLTGPIAVAGAQPGDMLAVTFASLTPDDWGFTVAGRKDDAFTRLLAVEGGVPQWLLWEVDGERGIAVNDLGQTVRLAPFLGVVGVPPADQSEASTIPPRADGGGNIDCRALTAGSTLYLPVTVPDALLCVGDGHGAQGDGEVGGTAIECGMTSELVLDLVTEPPLTSIHAVTPTSRITFGFNADLNLATAEALSAMLTWMQSLFGIDRTRALALASTVVNLRITQIANETWGVHAVLKNDAVQ